jgi:hypothetical protein
MSQGTTRWMTLRGELQYLTGQLGIDAAFLISSLIRAVDAELVDPSERYGYRLA